MSPDHLQSIYLIEKCVKFAYSQAAVDPLHGKLFHIFRDTLIDVFKRFL